MQSSLIRVFGGDYPPRKNKKGIFMHLKNKKNTLLWGLLGACALFLGMPNPFCHVPFIVLFYPISLYMIAIISPSPFRHGMLCGLFAVSASMYFIAITVHVYGNLPYVLAIPCTLIFGAYIGFYGGIFAFAMKKALVLPLFMRIIFAGLFWYVCEEVRAYVFTGFPWLSLSSAFVPIPELIQGASIVGGFFLSGVFVSIACLFVETWQLESWRHNFKSEKQSFDYSSLLPLCIGVFMLFALYLYGFQRIQSADSSFLDKEQSKNPYQVHILRSVDSQNSDFIKQHEDPSYVGQASHILVVPEEFLQELGKSIWKTEEITLLEEENRKPIESNTYANKFDILEQDFLHDWLFFTAVQGNVSQAIKWDKSFQDATVTKYLRLSHESLSIVDNFFNKEYFSHFTYDEKKNRGLTHALNPYVPPNLASQEDSPLTATFFASIPQIFLWPETAMPFYFQTQSVLTEQIMDFVYPMRRYDLYGQIEEEEEASSVDTTLVATSYRHLIFGGAGLKIVPKNTSDSEALSKTKEIFTYNPSLHIVEAYYNRLFFLQGENLSYYDKEHLVPFGEYVPDIPFLPSLFKDLLQGLDIFTAGQDQKLLTLEWKNFKNKKNFALTERSAQISALICYEAIFPKMAREDVEMGAELFINVSNDAWYDRTSAAAQHLYLSVMRAVEQKRFIVRAGNTGISAFVDEYGRILAETELFEDATLSGFVKLCHEKTVFFFITPFLLPVSVLVLLMLCGVIWMRKQKDFNLKSA